MSALPTTNAYKQWLLPNLAYIMFIIQLHLPLKVVTHLLGEIYIQYEPYRVSYFVQLPTEMRGCTRVTILSLFELTNIITPALGVWLLTLHKECHRHSNCKRWVPWGCISGGNENHKTRTCNTKTHKQTTSLINSLICMVQ